MQSANRSRRVFKPCERRIPQIIIESGNFRAATSRHARTPRTVHHHAGGNRRRIGGTTMRRGLGGIDNRRPRTASSNHHSTALPQSPQPVTRRQPAVVTDLLG
eukprot:COSAG02_NODE_1209_length_13869_cov_5.683660_6_plen_103_part_00